MNEVKFKHIASAFAQVLRPFWWSVALMIVVAITFGIELSLRPYLLKIIVDRVSSTPPHEVWHVLLAPIFISISFGFFIQVVCRLYDYFVCIKMIPQMRRHITQIMIRYLLDHSHQFYQNNFAGSLASRVSELTSAMPDIIQLTLDRLLQYALMLLVALFALYQVQAFFAVALFTWIVLVLLVIGYSAKTLYRFSENWSEVGSSIVGRTVDILSNINSVRLFAQKQHEEESMDGLCKQAVRAEQKLQWAYYGVWIFYGISYFVLQVICFYVLLRERAANAVSVGDFVLVLSINSSIVTFLWELASHFTNFAKYWGRISQALRITATPIDIQDQPGAGELTVTRGEIVFENVKFSYPGAEALFQNKSLIIQPAKKIGLVGYSGSGKTTFVHLILRLFDVSDGRILIDGQDIREVTQASLHRAIGMIPQDTSLFHRTLMQNIAYGKPHASNEEIIEAARKAHAHDFIQALPEQYQTLVGERGVKLSGGQRQRIAIARAFLKNAPILILDEATSHLDSVTEDHIQESLWTLMQNKTTLVIAHRLSTLLHMDQIVVFERGVIKEVGTHQELLSREGLYKMIWDTQVGGFLQEY